MFRTLRSKKLFLLKLKKLFHKITIEDYNLQKRIEKDIWAVKKSDFYDENWYRETYFSNIKQTYEPAEHYVQIPVHRNASRGDDRPDDG